MDDEEEKPDIEEKIKNYEVGYKKPPVQHRWKKGQPSPNRSGRPRGSKLETFDLEERLSRPVTVRSQNKMYTVRFLQALIETIMDRALRGNVKDAKLLLDLARERGLLNRPLSAEPIEVTLNIPNPPKKWTEAEVEEKMTQHSSVGKTGEKDE